MRLVDKLGAERLLLILGLYNVLYAFGQVSVQQLDLRRKSIVYLFGDVCPDRPSPGMHVAEFVT